MAGDWDDDDGADSLEDVVAAELRASASEVDEGPQPSDAEVDAALDQVAGPLAADAAADEGPPPATGEEIPYEFPFRRAAAKVREFPRTTGVYLFKDSSGITIYVGKAKNLRSRAGSYFLIGARHERRTADWVLEIADADYIECESDVDALLMEARLIKDIQPKYNKELKDDKTFPYLMITKGEDFPRVEVTRQPPDRGVRLFGPFASAGALRGAMQVLQRIFQVPHLQPRH
jgi:excinuclease ABC subunit C